MRSRGEPGRAPPVVTAWGTWTRQDLVARFHPPDQRHRGRIGRDTQHIGAYEVELDDERSVTFLDRRPPGVHGHARAWRSATDIVILVVAADDGVSRIP